MSWAGAFQGIGQAVGAMFAAKSQKDVAKQQMQQTDRINAQSIYAARQAADVAYYRQRQTEEDAYNRARAVNADNERIARDFATNGLQWTVDAARRAGIHPLAALGASHASVPTMVSSGSGSAPMAATPELKVAPGLPTSGSVYGAGAEGLGKALAAILDTDAAHRRNLENELTAAQAELYRAQSRTMIQNAVNETRNMSRGGRGRNDDEVPHPSGERGLRMKPPPGGALTGWRAWANMTPAPWLSDAQTIQDRHGEAADWLWSFLTIPSDLMYNAYRSSAAMRNPRNNRPMTLSGVLSDYLNRR